MVAMEACFRAWALHAPAGSKDKLLVSDSSAFAPSNKRTTVRRAHLVYQASNTLNEVLEATTDANWEEMVMGCDTPVLLEFWAPWCGPYQMIAPVIDELTKVYAGKIKCCKVNMDESPDVSSQCGIHSIPTILIFKGGEKEDSPIGAVPITTLTSLIDKYISTS